MKCTQKCEILSRAFLFGNEATYFNFKKGSGVILGKFKQQYDPVPILIT